MSMRLGDFEIPEPVPQLREPHILAVLRPWIDVGNVGSLSLGRVERHLRATEMGRLVRPGRFYDFTRYRPRSYLNQGRREFSIPNTVIRYASREEGPDLILLHLLEPHLYGEDYADMVLEVVKYFGVRRYSLIGGMYDMVPHTRPLLVSGAASMPQVEEQLGSVRVRQSTYEGPTTITYPIALQAAEAGVETRTYVVHLPQYLQVDEDFAGTARLMEIVCTLYNLPQQLVDQERGQQQYASLQRMVVNDTSGVASLLRRLEERYDREQQEGDSPPTSLSPNIEQFLRDLDSGFDKPA
jgi:hypothetical protein